jgi:signal transduction histidine kinase/TRAP-type C4-dicarboxylate transport system permease small subunit
MSLLNKLKIMKQFFKFSYQAEIRLSLLLFILFFLLVNFEVVYLLNLSQKGWSEESLQNLKGGAYSISQLWQDNPDRLRSSGEIKNLFPFWGFKRVEILNQHGVLLFSSDNKTDMSAFQSTDSSLNLLRSRLASGKSFFSEIYPGPQKRFYQSYFYSFLDFKTQATLYCRVEKEVSRLEWIVRISKYEGWVRGLGIFGVVFMAFVLLRNIFSPYQKMKRKAEEENIFSSSGETEDIESVIEVFQRVITELKEKERKLQELYLQTDNRAKNLERYNEHILRSINNGVIICDNQGRITGFNQSAQRLLGQDFNLSYNQHYKQALAKYTVLCNLLEGLVIKKNLSAETEIEMGGKKQGARFLLANGGLLRDEEENIIGLVLVLTDLTELKKIQQEIVQQQKMASIGEISAGLAHELRNSMGALLGYCKMLKKGIKEGSAAYPVMESILSESLTLENLLQRFLDFAKPLEVKWVKFDLLELIQDCVKIIQEKKPEVKLSLKTEGKIPLLPGDPFLLRQAFQNLIQNSIEAVPEDGEIKIELTRFQDSKGPFAKLIIQDNGCGISKENLGKIFKPFFTSKEKGIGLGLSLVKKIINLHKGRIEAESEPGKGTVFNIFLPMTEPEIKSEPEKVSNLKAAEVSILDLI